MAAASNNEGKADLSKTEAKSEDLCSVCNKVIGPKGCVGILGCEHHVHAECGRKFGMLDGRPNWWKSVPCKICTAAKTTVQ